MSAQSPGRRPIAAVIGSSQASAEQAAVARALGRCLVEEGFRVVSGGRGGVMEAASRGAHEAESYQPGDVIAVLPTFDAAVANPWVDVPICTGINHARNLIVVATGDVVLAVGGTSGTLSEIALAWQIGKSVIVVGDLPGWSGRLAGAPLDEHRDDPIHGPLEPAAAARFARELLADRTPKGRYF